MTDLIGKKAIQVQFTQFVRVLDGVQLEYTTPHHTLPPDIGPQPVLRTPVATMDGAAEFIVEEILSP